MMTKISYSITKRLFSKNHNETQLLMCQYGLELWIYTITSTIGLILIGVLLNAVLEASAIICIYYICQSNGGGFHASTHLRCFLTMACGLIAGLALLKWHVIITVAPFLGGFSGFILLRYPLCLHRNKSYLKEDSPRLIKRSRSITICLMALSAVLYLYNRQWFSVACIALLEASASRMTAIFMQKAAGQ